MTSDDDRVEYLAGGTAAGDVDAVDRAQLDDVRDLLADPFLWSDPPAGLEDRVVAAIAAEHAPAHGTMPHRRRNRFRVAGIGAAAAAIVVVVLLAGSLGGDDDQAEIDVALTGSAGASGELRIVRTPSGWRLDLDATGLPRLDRDRLYQAWLRDDDGTLVPVGTFNEGTDVVLWAGVSPADFSTFTVTREDVVGDPASSGDRVLVGEIVVEP